MAGTRSILFHGLVRRDKKEIPRFKKPRALVAILYRWWMTLNMATESKFHRNHGALCDLQLTDQWRHHQLLNDDVLIPNITSLLHDLGLRNASEVERIFKLCKIDINSLPYGLSESSTQYISLSPESERFSHSHPKPPDSIVSNNGSCYSIDDSNQKPTGFHSYVDSKRQIESWIHSYERHEFIAYQAARPDTSTIQRRRGRRNPSSKKWQNAFAAIIRLDDGEESDRIFNKSRDRDKYVSECDEGSGTDSISDMYRVAKFRVKAALENKPRLATRIWQHISPKLHFLNPLFKGDGLLRLLEEDVVDGEQEKGPQPTSSSTSQFSGSTLGWTSRNYNASSKRLREHSRDDDDDKGSKRNKKHPTLPSLPPEEPWKKPKFKCPFYAKCCNTHCKKNGRASTSLGYDTFHHIQDHFNHYHIVIRCQRCHRVFKGDTAMTSKNEHQKTCSAQAPAVTDDVIDCDMKAKLNQNIRRFRTWSMENSESQDQNMNAWISNCIIALTGITKPRAELGNDDLRNLKYGERELAKWYTCWTTLFSSEFPIPEHPFYEPNISSTVQNRQRLQVLFEVVATALAEENGHPPAGFQGQVQWFQNCLSIVLNLLAPPASNTTSTFEPDLTERIARILDMQGRIPGITQPALAIQDQNVSPVTSILRIVGDQQLQGQPAQVVLSIQQHAWTEEPLSPSQYSGTTERITSNTAVRNPLTFAPATTVQFSEEAMPDPAESTGWPETQTSLPLSSNSTCQNCGGLIFEETWQEGQEEPLPSICYCTSNEVSVMSNDLWAI
ncbi:hypothetical protein B7463_g6407, partial [Scytalidium lignicola]